MDLAVAKYDISNSNIYARRPTVTVLFHLLAGIESKIEVIRTSMY